MYGSMDSNTVRDGQRDNCCLFLFIGFHLIKSGSTTHVKNLGKKSDYNRLKK
jgi:hypothetical protein